MSKFLIILSLLPFFSLASAGIPQASQLTLEQKVGQLLLVHFHGDAANNDAKILIEELGVGGIIYFNWANDLTSPEKVSTLSQSLKQMAAKASSIPLLIAVDQEGGLVARLKNGFTPFPGNRALGETNMSELARQCAWSMGQELKAVGINMNLAPVVDVNSNALNPVIGIRSFGCNPEKVTEFGKAALKGYKDAGIITSLKHFPGHGDTVVDSHKSMPVLNKSIEELSQVELIPFTQLCSQADTIMTAHLMVPALDKNNCATLSPQIIEGLLRVKMGYKGVIVTDSLIMKGVLDNAGSVQEAALRALQAGNDMLILGGRQSLEGNDEYLEITVDDIKNIKGYIIVAVREGRLSMQRIDDAVERVLSLKRSHLVDTEAIANVNKNSIRSTENLKLSKMISSLSVHILSGNENLPVHLSDKKILLIAPESGKSEIINSNIMNHLGKAQTNYFFQGLEPSPENISEMKELSEQADIVVFLSYNAWKIPRQKEAIEELNKAAPFVLIALRDPEDANLVKNAICTVATYSPIIESIEAAFDKIK